MRPIRSSPQQGHRPLVIGLIVAGLMLCGLAWCATHAQAHDSWISRGALRNGAGEWCCGPGDCFVIPSHQVELRHDGYYIVFRQTVTTWGHGYGVVETTSTRAEIVPLAEVQPSPDGAFWRCKRPDGSRRCFFAPPPNT